MKEPSKADDNVSIKEDVKSESSSTFSEDDFTDTSSADDEKDDFDWVDSDDEDTMDDPNKRCAICLSRHSSKTAWIIFIILTLISIGVCISVFVATRPQSDPRMKSYNLALWFTFIAFMFCISFIIQCLVEIIPWFVKIFFNIFVPQKSEVLRSRLSYYMALKPYTKLLFIGAWAWGAWAFLRREIKLPPGRERPLYVKKLEYVMECFFLLMVFLYIEKFILQLIVTAFHKKAYGDRLYSNEKALRYLDKLKTVKRVSPQDFLMKRIRRNKGGTTPKDEKGDSPARAEIRKYAQTHKTKQAKSIIKSNDDIEVDPNSKRHSVRFPSKQRMETLIAIPPVGGSDASTPVDEETDIGNPSINKSEKNTFFKGVQQNLKKYTRRNSANSDDTKVERDNDEAEEEGEENEERALDEYEDNNPQDFDRKRQVLNRSNTGLSTTSSMSDEKSILAGTSLLKSNYKRLLKDTALNQDPIRHAKYLAKQIFYNVMGRNPIRQYIVEGDFYGFFRTHEQAKEAFELFDANANGDISKLELKTGCIRIFRERKDLARSLRDMTQATGKLDIILLVVFACIWAIAVMAVFGVNIGSQLMPLWSAFIAASFIFGNTARDAFESIIFIFVTHPFDTGDRVLIDSQEWCVANVGLMVSTFLNCDGVVTYIKNSVLATLYIHNYRRSGRTSEGIILEVDYDTPSWKLHHLEDSMSKWANDHPKLYTSNSVAINILKVVKLNMIEVVVIFQHAKNYQDAVARRNRHNDFMLALKDECDRLKISYSHPVQPVLNQYPKMGNDSDDSLESLKNEYMSKPRRRSKGVAGGDEGDGGDGGSGGFGGGGGGSGGDSGATAGSAATVAFTTLSF